MTSSAFSGLHMGDTGFVLIYTSWWAGTVCILCSFFKIINEWCKIPVLWMVVVPHRGNDYHCCVEKCFKGPSTCLQSFEVLLGRNLNKPKVQQLLVRFPPNSSISHPKVFNILCVKTINIPSSAPQDDICNVISVRHPPLSCCFSL